MEVPLKVTTSVFHEAVVLERFRSNEKQGRIMQAFK